MPPKELWEAYINRTVRPSVRPSVPLRVRCISPIFFEVGIPNLVCFVCLFVFVALRLKSTAMVIAGRSVHLTTLFPGQA